MTAPLFILPTRATDANGSPYAGALANFYATGTTTRQPTYTTSGLSVEHTNPVVADSGGKFPNIYLDPDITYRAVITNSTGSVTLHDIDPANDTSLGSIAGLVAKAEVHVFDYIPVAKHAGIIASTNTDDLAAYIQDALDTGKLVRLPDVGTGWIASTLRVPSGGGLVGGFGFTLKAKANFGNIPMIGNANYVPATLGARDKGIILRVRLDGNKANNATATEFAHGVELKAVDGALLDVWTANTKGDGVILAYSRGIGDGATAYYDIGCRDIKGHIRSETAARQGVAVTCGEDCDLSIFAYQSDLIGFDIEPDQATSYGRNNIFRVLAQECGQAASGTRGGILVHGTNGDASARADVSNNIIDFVALDCEGTAGVMWRDVDGLILRGLIAGQTGEGIYGLEGAFSSSNVRLDGVRVLSATGSGLLSRNLSDRIDGEIEVEDCGNIGIDIQGGNGGVLRARVNSAGQQGLSLLNTTNMTFPDCQTTGNSGSGVSLTGTSSGNRFPGLKSTGSTFGWGFQEAGSCNNNRVTNGQISGNSLGTATLVGSTSMVELEPLHGKATYDAPSIAAAGTATTTVTVTGAAVGDQAKVTFGVSLAGLVATAYVSAANTVTVVLFNPTGGAVDLASTTVKATVTPRVVT